jgi:GTPase KRas protein
MVTYPPLFVKTSHDRENEITHPLLHTEGRDLVKHFGCRFIETSTKQRINVDEAFSNLVRKIRKYIKVRFFFLWVSCPFVPPLVGLTYN